jgi:hypothetical protein
MFTKITVRSVQQIQRNPKQMYTKFNNFRGCGCLLQMHLYVVYLTLLTWGFKPHRNTAL